MCGKHDENDWLHQDGQWMSYLTKVYVIKTQCGSDLRYIILSPKVIEPLSVRNSKSTRRLFGNPLKSLQMLFRTHFGKID